MADPNKPFGWRKRIGVLRPTAIESKFRRMTSRDWRLAEFRCAYSRQTPSGGARMIPARFRRSIGEIVTATRLPRC